MGHEPPTRVLVLTTFDLNEYVYDALRAGASGFLLKDVPPEQLVAGVHVVARGEALLAPTITKRLIEEFAVKGRVAAPAAPAPEIEELTPRELEVFRLIARGMSNAELATYLVVSETTVKTHVARILMKLGLRDRVQAVVFAYEHGVVAARRGRRGLADRTREVRSHWCRVSAICRPWRWRSASPSSSSSCRPPARPSTRASRTCSAGGPRRSRTACATCSATSRRGVA